MATTRMICYVAVCDGCHQEFETDYTVHNDWAADAIGYATEYDWVSIGNKLYCERCAEGYDGVPCANCDDLVECEGDFCRFCRDRRGRFWRYQHDVSRALYRGLARLLRKE